MADPRQTSSSGAKHTRLLMGMPISVEIRDRNPNQIVFDKVFAYFQDVDNRFSTYKQDSEISKINRKEISLSDASRQMQEVFALAEETKKFTEGYFDIRTPHGGYDPSGLVKGWAIYGAAQLLDSLGFEDFFVEAGGDIQAKIKNPNTPGWRVGIRNPYNRDEIVKVLEIRNEGIATSGSYIRGSHIYNPHRTKEVLSEVLSITVIGPNIYEADRFATAAFAMGKDGINFIQALEGFEAYQIDKFGQALSTSNFQKYVINPE